MTSVSNDLAPAVPRDEESIPPNRLRNPAYLHRDATTYLDGVADELGRIKQTLRRFLAPRAGQRLVDVGCGAGGDVLALSREVGPIGEVVGVDTSEELIAQARQRAGGRGFVRFQVGDATALPLADDAYDGARAERVLQHVGDPPAAVSEMLRITVPGGRVVLAEPDHEMWVVNTSDVATTRDLLTWWVGHIRNPAIGRRLPELLRGAGACAVRVEVLPVILTGLAAADAVIGLGKVAAAVEAARAVPAERTRAWQEDLLRRDARDSLITIGAIVVAYGDKPGTKGDE